VEASVWSALLDVGRVILHRGVLIVHVGLDWRDAVELAGRLPVA
jgi:hypothetical protein